MSEFVPYDQNLLEFCQNLSKYLNMYCKKYHKCDHIPGRKSQTEISHLRAAAVHDLMRDLRLVIKGIKPKYLIKGK